LTNLLVLIADSMVYILPAYTANAAPVIFGGGRPLDSGKIYKDGRPILGSHKTFRGFFAGIIVGTLVGIGLSFLSKNQSPSLGFTLSFGAIMGDLMGAFLKRRLELEPGALLPVVDQVDFVIGAIVFSLPITAPSLNMVLIILILTLPVHFLTNLIAYFLHLKERPW
jgi:CDP-2,3-bis-(O-geranylgeranyl)-sn-glycerol synthase